MLCDLRNSCLKGVLKGQNGSWELPIFCWEKGDVMHWDWDSLGVGLRFEQDSH